MDIVKIIRKLSPLKIGIASINDVAVFYLEKKKIIYRLISNIKYSETEYYEVPIKIKGILMEMLHGDELIIKDGVLQNKELRYAREGQHAKLPISGSFSKKEYFDQMNAFDELETSNFIELSDKIFKPFDIAKNLGIDTLNIAKFKDFVCVYALNKIYAGIREIDLDKIKIYGDLNLSVSITSTLFNIIANDVIEYNLNSPETRAVSAYRITNDSMLLESDFGNFYALIPDQSKKDEDNFIIRKMIETINGSNLYEFEFDKKALSYIKTMDRHIKFQSVGIDNSISTYICVSGSYMKTKIKTNAPQGVFFEVQAVKLQKMLPNNWNTINVGNQCIISSQSSKFNDINIIRQNKEYIVSSA